MGPPMVRPALGVLLLLLLPVLAAANMEPLKTTITITDTTLAETTVREKRSTTALNATTTDAEATTAASTAAENSTTDSQTDSTTSAAATNAAAATTEAAAVVNVAAAAATEAAAAVTEATVATTKAAAPTTEAAAPTTEAAAAATEAAAVVNVAAAAATEAAAAVTEAAAATTKAAAPTTEAAATATETAAVVNVAAAAATEAAAAVTEAAVATTKAAAPTTETAAAATEAAAAVTEAAAATTKAAAPTTEAAAAATEAAAAVTKTPAATTAAAANATADAANATADAANATADAANTTTTSTTTETPLPFSARLKCQLSITSQTPEKWMTLSFTEQYQKLAGQVESLVAEILREKYGDNFQSVSVTHFDIDSGSVVPKLDVTVMTDKTRAEDVDAKALASEMTAALQTLIEERDFTFDKDAAQTSEEIELIEPTTTPAPTEDPYKFTILRLTMRAPFANWTDEMNDTESDTFAEFEAEIQKGVDLMVSKKYPKGEWNVSSSIIWMLNDTETSGVLISFFVTVEPQMTNTSKVVEELARSFVYFNPMGSLVIAPDSVNFKDMTTYAPGRGVVIMDKDYLRELRKSKYNGSYVGDYTTQPPTLRPVIKRHHGNVLGIAVPAFLGEQSHGSTSELGRGHSRAPRTASRVPSYGQCWDSGDCCIPLTTGMIAAIGLLLICSTIAGAKKSDD